MHPKKAHAPLMIIHGDVRRPEFVCGGDSPLATAVVFVQRGIAQKIFSCIPANRSLDAQTLLKEHARTLIGGGDGMGVVVQRSAANGPVLRTLAVPAG